MEPKYQPQLYEERIYRFWERNNLFEAKVNQEKKPFSIILPPPNANADLHLGHAMYVYEDIMIRFHKLIGEVVLWLPGADHAGFETQYVFEKYLKKQGKSRFDFDEKTLYQMIWDFVQDNRKNMENQLRKLGFALDWSKKKFTLDEDIIAVVKETFKKLFDEGLAYYDKAIVNYCVNCGTSFSDLEVVYQEKKGKLWYILYPFDRTHPEKGGITVATTRPETMLGDMAVAVHPKDKRYKNLVGKEVNLPIVNREIKIIADKAVDPKFGTGAVKVTPAHDPIDWEIAKRHNLLLRQVIDSDGKMTIVTPKEFQGKKVHQAKDLVLQKLKDLSLLIKEENYTHRVGTCYKCGRVIEPLPMGNWFIKIKPLAKKAKELVVSEKIKIYPKRFKKILLWWLNHFHDWNISRQVVWGIKIPAYYCNICKKWFVSVDSPKKCPHCQKNHFLSISDTFDTWFSSAQWPFATLMTQSGNSKFQVPNSKKKTKKTIFDYFYPTTVMETGYDILPWWVARMIMIGYFVTKKPPFLNVVLHGLVRDKKGQKMSKSKGNVINPLEMINKYGADALRLALVYETTLGADINFSEERIIGMRNFINKVWNIGRFIYLNTKSEILNSPKRGSVRDFKQIQNSNEINSKHKIVLIKNLEDEFKTIKKKYLQLMKNYRFSPALVLLHNFLWHRLADFYIEESKKLEENDKIKFFIRLEETYLNCLLMLHPFAPFVSEAIWQVFKSGKSIYQQSLISVLN